MEDDDSSDELHIDEGQDYSTSNSISMSDGIHNAYSSNAGAYNALLGFGGRGDAYKLNPRLTSNIRSPYMPTGTSNEQYDKKAARNLTNSSKLSKKGSRHSGSTQSNNYKNRNVRATAEPSFSSSNLFSENSNMAVPGSLNSCDMENVDRNVIQGAKRTLKIQSARKSCGTKNRKTHHVANNRIGMTSFNSSQYNIASSFKENEQSQNYSYSENVITKRQCPKITQYITDRPSRLKSYFRRRHVPFKRIFDMNLQCGTSSLLIQISDDIEECLFHGEESLVEPFLDPGQGLKLSQVTQIIQQGKSNRRMGRLSKDECGFSTTNGQTVNEKKVKKRQFNDLLSNDEDFYATVKEKEQKEREKKKEAQQRLIEGDFLSNPAERNKAFKSRKDSLINKMSETDEVCATKSFLVIINHDNDAVFYHGHPTLVTKFFTTGLARDCVSKKYNIRMLDPEEVDQNAINTCSVPQCVVTRNSLSKWRIAAMSLFNFPSHLPMTLYTCSEAEKERWIAELDLNPLATGRIAVCSLHFKDGEPTDEFPLPTELLSDKDDRPLTFRGNLQSINKDEEQQKCSTSINDYDKSINNEDKNTARQKYKMLKPVRSIFTQLFPLKQRKPLSKRMKTSRALRYRRRKRLLVAEAIPGDKQSAWARKRNRALLTNYGSKFQCRFCVKTFTNTFEYIQHVRCHHLNLPPNAVTKNQIESNKSDMPLVEKSETSKVDQSMVTSTIDDSKESKATLLQSTESIHENSPLLTSMQSLLTSIKIEESELGSLLRDLYPTSTVKTMNPRKKYVCAVCKSVCDLFGLFTHMKTVHKGLLCQYCLKLFKKVADLEIHLNKTHKVYRRYYRNKETFKEYSGNSYTFACTLCSSFVPFEKLESHKCAEDRNKQYDCPFCERLFERQEQLELHLANGWCKTMTWMLKTEYNTDTYTNSMLRSKRLAVLTGNKDNEPINAATLTAFETESRIYEPVLWRPSSNISHADKQIFNTREIGPKSSKAPIRFNPWDRNFMQKFSSPIHSDLIRSFENKISKANVIIADIPNTGSIFFGSKVKGFNHFVNKEEDEVGEKYDLVQKFKDAAKSSYPGTCPSLDGTISRMQIFKAKNNFFIHNNRELLIRQSSISAAKAAKAVSESVSASPLKKTKPTSFNVESLHSPKKMGAMQHNLNLHSKDEMIPAEDKENSLNNLYPSNKYQTSVNFKTQLMGVSLKNNLSTKRENKAERMLRMGAEIEFGFTNLRKTLDHFAGQTLQLTEKTSNDGKINISKANDENSCILCQQSRILTVDAIFVYTHLITHDQQVTISILNEDPQDAISRLKKYFKDSRLQEMTFQYASLNDECESQEDETENEGNVEHNNYRQFLGSTEAYNCCCCSNTSSKTYIQLLDHLNTIHNSKVLTCQLCQNIFLNYGSFISHVCYGPASSTTGQPQRAKFSCKVCDKHDLETFLEFQHHIRKTHNVCEICLRGCESQEELYEHCIQHSNELMCMKCFRAYDDQMQFRKHLYFNHHSEHQICAQCHRKSWPHVYHFCLNVLAYDNTCEVCDQSFDDFQKYRVHFRIHTGVHPYTCSSQGCGKSYISKQLLYKHNIRRHPDLRADAERYLFEKRNKREMDRFGATQNDSVKVVHTILDFVIGNAVTEHSNKTLHIQRSDTTLAQDLPLPEITAAEILANLGDATVNDSMTSSIVNEEKLIERDSNKEYDPVDAAVRSIMDIDSMFNIKRSPVKNNIASPLRAHQQLSKSDDTKLLDPNRVPTMNSQAILKPSGQGGTLNPIKIAGQGNHKLSPVKGTAIQIALQKSNIKCNSSSNTFNSSNSNNIITSTCSSKVLLNSNTPTITAQPNTVDDMAKSVEIHNSVPKATTISSQEQAAEKLLKKNDDDETKNKIMENNLPNEPASPIHPDQTTVENETKLNKAKPVFGSIWNQDLLFISNEEPSVAHNIQNEEIADKPGDPLSTPQLQEESAGKTIENLDSKTINKKLVTGQGWDVDLSESSDDSDNEGTAPKKARTVKIKERKLHDVRITLRDHDYCFESYLTSVRPPPKPEVVEDLSEMDKILSNVAMGASIDNASISTTNEIGIASILAQDVDAGSVHGIKKHKKNKKNKKKKKKKNRRKSHNYDPEKDGGSSSSDSELDVVNSAGTLSKKALKNITALPKGPKPKFHTPTGAAGITAAAARPHFSSSDDEKDSESDEKINNSPEKKSSDHQTSDSELASSDLDTDFSADDLPSERITSKSKRITRPSAKVAEAAKSKEFLSTVPNDTTDLKRTVKLKIKLPPKPLDGTSAAESTPQLQKSNSGTKAKLGVKSRKATTPSAAAAARRQAKLIGNTSSLPAKVFTKKKKNRRPSLLDREDTSKMSEKMRRSLALNRSGETDTDSDVSNNDMEIADDIEISKDPENNVTINHSLPDAKVYCYCQSPHDDVSEMIGCDAPDCKLEWFHFECVGIMVPPEGQWYCPECSKKYQYQY